MDEMARVRREYGGRKLYLNATGGYKPESAFALVSALLLGYNGVYYIHEAYRRLVVLPSPPLSLRGEYLGRLLALSRLGGEAPLHHLLENEGWSMLEADEMAKRGLVSIEEGVVRLRRWVASLLASERGPRPYPQRNEEP
jgi:CRISPR/Cas system-associated protein Csm6